MTASDDALGLFEQALDLPPDARERFLDEACRADPALRARLAAMLRADGRPHSLLDAPPGALVGRLDETERPGWLGQRVGPYRLLRELGRGGMGVVYLAERADVGLLAAVKLGGGSRDHPAPADRFEQERRLLARLEHPHIARFLDAGSTAAGTPWLAMEYVEGQPIDAHCDARCLSIEDRLALFAQVGEAVGYAHQRQLVHRDLKPSNILVSEAGVPKLVDFGIAKLLETDDPASRLTREPGLAPMTPEYASPEQVRGEPITAASDVYQLGILLHELLTGRRPAAPNGDALRPFDRAHCLGMAAPSALATREVSPTQVAGGGSGRTASELSSLRRLTPGQLRRRLANDLDAIVRKALRCDPARRYPTARELVDDVARHLRGERILADPGPPALRLRKLVRRHRLAATLVAAIAVVTSGALLGLAHQSDDLTRERRRADQASAILEELVLDADPARAGRDTAATRSVLRAIVSQSRSRLGAEPEVWGRILYVAGDVFRGIGRIDTAMALWREVIAALEPRDSLEPTLLIALGMLGNAQVELGDTAAGLAVLDRLAIRARTLPASRRRERAELLYKVAYGRELAGDDRTAGRLNGEVLGILATLPDSGGIVHDRTLLNLGRLANRAGEYERAEALFRRARAVRQARDGPEHERTVNAVAGLAEALLGSGDLAEADTLSAWALAIRRRLYSPPHLTLAQGLTLRAEALVALGRRAEAASLVREALEQYRRLLPPGHPTLAAATAALEAAANGPWPPAP